MFLKNLNQQKGEKWLLYFNLKCGVQNVNQDYGCSFSVLFSLIFVKILYSKGGNFNPCLNFMVFFVHVRLRDSWGTDYRKDQQQQMIQTTQ